MSTADFRALHDAWVGLGETSPLDLSVVAARERLADATEIRERLYFSGWVNTLREVAEREAEAHAAWRKAVRWSGVGVWEESC